MKRFAAIAFAGLALGAAAPPGPVVPAVSRTYADWHVRCFAVETPSPCDIFQALLDRKTKLRRMSVSIAYVPEYHEHIIQIAVPATADRTRGALVLWNGGQSPALTFRRCKPDTCFVEMVMDEDWMSGMLAASGSAAVRIFNGDAAVDFPLSLSGFTKAHSAMQELARTQLDYNRRSHVPPPPAAATP